jgi:hypothetical protein
MPFDQDFPNKTCYASVLHDALVATAGITTPIDSVQYLRASNATRIVWNTTPSAAEQTAAATTVAAHVAVVTTFKLHAPASIVPGEAAIVATGGLWQVLGGVVTRPDFFAPLSSLFGRCVLEYRATGGTLKMRLVERKPGGTEVVVSADPKVLADTSGVWTIARFDTLVPFRVNTNTYRLEAQLNGAVSADVRFVSLSLLEAVSKQA